MTVYAEDSWKVIENTETEDGIIIRDHIEVVKEWVVEVPAETEYVVIAEYPNGGKDVEERIVTPEKGHWENQNKDIPGNLTNPPEDYPHDQPFVKLVEVERYHKYTPEEIEQHEAEKKATEDAKKQAEFIDSLPQTVSDTDAAICELYEMMIGE